MGTPNFYPEKKTKFFSGLKGGVPRVPPITTLVLKLKDQNLQIMQL